MSEDYSEEPIKNNIGESSQGIKSQENNKKSKSKFNLKKHLWYSFLISLALGTYHLIVSDDYYAQGTILNKFSYLLGGTLASWALGGIGLLFRSPLTCYIIILVFGFFSILETIS